MRLTDPIPQISARVNREADWFDPAFPNQDFVALDLDRVEEVSFDANVGRRLVFRRLDPTGAPIANDSNPARYEIVVVIWPTPSGEMQDSKSYNVLTICDPGFAARAEWDSSSAAELWAELKKRGLTERV